MIFDEWKWVTHLFTSTCNVVTYFVETCREDLIAMSPDFRINICSVDLEKGHIGRRPGAGPHSDHYVVCGSLISYVQLFAPWNAILSSSKRVRCDRLFFSGRIAQEGRRWSDPRGGASHEVEVSYDGPLPWRRPLSKGIKHRYLAQFLIPLTHWKWYMRVLWVDLVGVRAFIHSRSVWVENDDDSDRVVGITRCYPCCVWWIGME